MLRLQLLQPVHQRVVLRVRQLRRIHNVVKMLVVAKLIVQRLYLLVGRKCSRHSDDYKERQRTTPPTPAIPHARPSDPERSRRGRTPRISLLLLLVLAVVFVVALASKVGMGFRYLFDESVSLLLGTPRLQPWVSPISHNWRFKAPGSSLRVPLC